MLPHERFDAWRYSHQLAVAVYRVTKRWPSDERFGLTSQCRRAAVSVAANIAEGAARRGPREFRRYLNVSFASLAEVAALLRVARDVGVATAEDWKELDALREPAGKCIGGLYRSLSR